MEYAATNDIIVVFPQNKYNLFGNLYSCWSHQDYSLLDKDYYNNLGVQNKAFKSMIDRLTSAIDTATYDYDGWRPWLSSQGENLAD